jgi:hypothetical protein
LILIYVSLPASFRLSTAERAWLRYRDPQPVKYKLIQSNQLIVHTNFHNKFTGILGLTGITGFLFYLLAVLGLFALLIIKSGSDWQKYFIDRRSLLTNGFMGGLFTYILFWTFLYSIHVY